MCFVIKYCPKFCLKICGYSFYWDDNGKPTHPWVSPFLLTVVQNWRIINVNNWLFCGPVRISVYSISVYIVIKALIIRKCTTTSFRVRPTTINTNFLSIINYEIEVQGVRLVDIHWYCLATPFSLWRRDRAMAGKPWPRLQYGSAAEVDVRLCILGLNIRRFTSSLKGISAFASCAYLICHPCPCWVLTLVILCWRYHHCKAVMTACISMFIPSSCP